MTVRAVLALINQILESVLAEHDGAYDADSRWAIAWFEIHGHEDGTYGDAETLARAKNTSVAGLDRAGIVRSKGSKVRLLRGEELDREWSPESDARFTVWELTHHLLVVHAEQGDAGAARLLARAGARSETARDLGYRLFTVCEQKKWSELAQGYNALVASWPDIEKSRGAVSAELPFGASPGTAKARTPARSQKAAKAAARRR